MKQGKQILHLALMYIYYYINMIVTLLIFICFHILNLRYESLDFQQRGQSKKVKYRQIRMAVCEERFDGG